MPKRTKIIRYRLKTNIFYEEIKIQWDSKKEFNELEQLELLEKDVGLEKIACYYVKK